MVHRSKCSADYALKAAWVLRADRNKTISELEKKKKGILREKIYILQEKIGN